MSLVLNKRGFRTAKIFVEGELRVDTVNSPKGYVEWWYHVAPVLCVEKDGVHQLMVIDPSLFDKPVSANEWVEIQTAHEKGHIDELYLAPPFSFGPSDSDRKSKPGFSSNDLERADDTLEKYLEIQVERQSAGLSGPNRTQPAKPEGVAQ